ncbi:MAG: hypothetical protein C0421_05835 [Hyphomonas sp.]|uniref:hypothetical protein n=1 Tax=Hyphomonas sp. TaxID=87 RepID=UPI0025C66DDB|nr:hypothetical protein [Hyphomonas sp.]MBA4338347.1 hypothetical protein [Hyphomonas sp.]
MTDAALFALALIYAARGLWLAHREVAFCRADNLRTGEAAPLWPVWLFVAVLWPMFDAQRGVLALLTLHDCAAARAEDKRETRRG